MLDRQPYLVAETVLDFCQSYIAASKWMELPYLKRDDDPQFSTVPISHIEFAKFELEREAQEKGLYQAVISQLIVLPVDNAVTAAELIRAMPTPRKIADDGPVGADEPPSMDTKASG